MIRQLIYREPDLAQTLVQQELKFRRNLVAAREASDLTQEQVARKMGVSPAWVREFEDLSVQPTLAQVRLYLLAINAWATFQIHL